MEKIIHQMSILTKSLLVVSMLFVIYGYVCRAIGLYFFWESSTLGWPLLLIGAISLLWDRINLKEPLREKVTLERIGIGLAAFTLVVQSILFVSLSRSDAYSAAKSSLTTYKQLESEIGTIEAFRLNPSGTINIMTDSTGEHGDAVIQLVVKGTKKFKDVTVYVAKHDEESGWKVESVE